MCRGVHCCLIFVCGGGFFIGRLGTATLPLDIPLTDARRYVGCMKWCLTIAMHVVCGTAMCMFGIRVIQQNVQPVIVN